MGGFQPIKTYEALGADCAPIRTYGWFGSTPFVR